MILAIDIGNTNTTLGIFKGKRLAAVQQIPTSLLQEARIWLTVRTASKHAGGKTRDISGVVIASVVPGRTALMRNVFRKKLRVRPLIVSARADCGVKSLYKNPASLGADRLCNAVAAYFKYGGPIIVIDFGTATKYEVVSRRGEHLGGAIGLGIGSSAEALHRRTAKLPSIALQFPKGSIGTDTVTCMQTGILCSAVDAAEGMIQRFKAIAGKQTKVVLTGGLSPLVASYSKIGDYAERYLVLIGARIIYERANCERG